MIIYISNFFNNFTSYLEYIGQNINQYPIMTYLIALVFIASAIDYIKRLLLM